MFELSDMDFQAGSREAEDGLHFPEAHECMRCGFCIGACPTFKIKREEGETPRARVRMIERLIRRNGQLSPEEHSHLTNCLLCRACETVCPSRMEYGRLFDRARGKLAGEAPASLTSRCMQWATLSVFERKSVMRVVAALLRLYQRSGLQKVLRRTGLLRTLRLARLDALLPHMGNFPPLPRFSPAAETRRGSVALFTGCIAETADRATHHAAVRVLNRIGFDVHIPAAQDCCGAVHRHLGLCDKAASLAARNVSAFNSLAVDAVLYSASGCGLMLTEYTDVGVEDKEAAAFCAKLQELAAFLEDNWPEGMKLEPLAGTAAVHEPCSQHHGLKTEPYTYALLRRIPHLAVEALPDNSVCCGAGGIHMVTHPDTALPLRDAKLDAFERSGADMLVTSNIGCALHLASQAGQRAPDIVHPVVLVDRQIP